MTDFLQHISDFDFYFNSFFFRKTVNLKDIETHVPKPGPDPPCLRALPQNFNNWSACTFLSPPASQPHVVGVSNYVMVKIYLSEKTQLNNSCLE